MRKLFIVGLLLVSSFIVRAQIPKLMLPIGHTDRVTSAQFSPDGERFLTASLDNTAKLWETKTGKLLAVLYGHNQGVNAALFSPDKKTIITIDGNGAVKLWDANSAVFLKRLEGHSLSVISAKFSPDGKKFLTNSADGTCKIWDLSNKKLLYSLICYRHIVTEDESGNYHSDDTGEKFEEEALKGYNEVMKKLNGVFDKIEIPKNRKDSILNKLDSMYYTPVIEAKKQAPKIIKFDSLYDSKKEYLKPFKANSAEFSSDSKRIITTASDGTIRIWNAETGKKILELKETLSEVQMANFSKDNLMFLTLIPNGVMVWNSKTGKLLYEIDEFEFETARFFPNENKILTTSEGLIFIWNSQNGKLLHKLEGHDQRINTVEFSADGKRLLTASADRTAKLWDLNSNKLLSDFIGHKHEVSSAQFSFDPSKIVTASFDFSAKVWDSATGEQLIDTKSNSSSCLSAFFSNDNSNIIVVHQNNTPKIWSRFSGRITGNIVENDGQINHARYSSDDKKILTNSTKSIKIWDSENQKELKSFENTKIYLEDTYAKPQLSPDGKFILNSNMNNLFMIDAESGEFVKGISEFPTTKFKSLEFSRDGKKILAIANNYEVKVWDNKKLGEFQPTSMWDKDPNAKELKGHLSSVSAARFSYDGKKIVTSSDDYSSKIFDVSSGKELNTFIGHTDQVYTSEFSKKGDKIATGSWDATAKIWDTRKNAILFDLRGHTSLVTSVDFSNDDKKLLTASTDNTCKIWDVGTGKLIYTFFSIDSLDYFSFLPNGYYLPSRNAVKKLHYVTKDLKVVSFEQLDVKYNRPDKVLQAIGNTDSTLIQSYKRAYEKRIEKLRIDTTAFSDDYNIPEADFVNREPRIENGKVVLRIKGEDKKSKLAQFNVWVNEVPVYGLRGVNIRHLNNYKLDTTITIQLSEGGNRIETSVRNLNGIESYRMPLNIKYNPETKLKEKVYFVGMGIDKFKDNSRNLIYSVTDIRVLTAEMQKKYGNNLIIVDTLINTKVTVENVKALKKKLLKTTVNDKVIVAYSGHGLLNSRNDYYLSTYSVDFKKPEENGLNYDDLESIIDSIPARKKLLLLDACHSGEVDGGAPPKPIKPNNDNGTAAIKNNMEKGGGEVMENTLKNRIGLKNSFELMQSLFVNVGKNTGATIFTAAAGKQAAYESNKLGHGVFTYFIIDAFRNKPTITVSKLKEFVAESVEKESKKSQIPTSRSETIAVDWVLW